MGRDAGWVALAASDAARHVNICLIPEFEVKKIKIIYLQFFFDLKNYLY
jgi:6-phosphofructokinase